LAGAPVRDAAGRPGGMGGPGLEHRRDRVLPEPWRRSGARLDHLAPWPRSGASRQHDGGWTPLESTLRDLTDRQASLRPSRAKAGIMIASVKPTSTSSANDGELIAEPSALFQNASPACAGRYGPMLSAQAAGRKLKTIGTTKSIPASVEIAAA